MANREIKFRAWDINNKNLFEIYDGTTQENWFLPSVNYNFIIMQYTGFKDKYGVEIYEGDILEILDNNIKSIKYFKVVFERGSFVCYHKLGFWGLLSKFLNININFKVIGNIHQNPELI